MGNADVNKGSGILRSSPPGTETLDPVKKRPMNYLQRKQPTVLLVDDESEVLEELAGVLGAAGFACECATTAEAAMALAETDPPDLIISDVNLNGHSGLEMCERIKRNPSLHDVPLMFLSGAQIPDIIRRSHAAGGIYYLRKPFDPSVLIELIDKALWMPHLVASHAAR